MCDLLNRLKDEKHRKGSKARCHSLTHGPRDEVAARLTELMGGHGTVSAADQWMPGGFANLDEAILDQAPRLMNDEHGRILRSWWLAVPRGNRPNWDIASTATINGRTGLLLVEAKAHTTELTDKEKGKTIKADASKDAWRNHEQIGHCIHAASASLAEQTDRDWNLSRDHHYQMSNRFAWAWKLTELGYPVVLDYLGFLNAAEMPVPFTSDQMWKDLVIGHSKDLFPAEVWDKPHKLRGQTFVPLIRSLEMPLCCTPALPVASESTSEDQAT